MVFHTHTTKPWGYTQACGMQRIGQQGVGLSKLTGRKPHSLLHTKTSVQMLAFGLMGHLLVVQVPPGVTAIHGYQNSWTTQPKARWNGCRAITWFTITALIPRGFPKACLKNAACPKTDKGRSINPPDSVIYFCHCRIALSLGYSFFIHTESNSFILVLLLFLSWNQHNY